MGKKAFSISKIRRSMYKGARILGDIQAVAKGPDAVKKRLKNRILGRIFGKLFWNFTKKI